MIEAGFLQRFGDLLVAAVVVGMAGFGYQHGVFLATLAGFDVLVSLFVALGFNGLVGDLLIAFGCPRDYAVTAAFGLLLVGTAFGIRLLVGSFVPEDAVRLPPLVDGVGGAAVGAVAGMAAAGALLVALSTVPLPEAYRIDGSQLQFDLGTTMLRTFAECVEPDPDRRQRLLDGYGPPVRGGALLCSELYVDANRNGRYDGQAEEQAAERFLDADGNGRFTSALPFSDLDAEGNRTLDRVVGLAERYRLGAWRNAAVMHTPAFVSADEVTLPDGFADGGMIYQASAIDLNPDEAARLRYSIRPFAAPAASEEASPETAADVAAEPAPMLVAIDAGSGVVTVPDVAALQAAEDPYRFVLVVTDDSGLSSDKVVTIKLRDTSG